MATEMMLGILFIVVIGGFIIATIILFRGVNRWQRVATAYSAQLYGLRAELAEKVKENKLLQETAERKIIILEDAAKGLSEQVAQLVTAQAGWTEIERKIGVLEGQLKANIKADQQKVRICGNCGHRNLHRWCYLSHRRIESIETCKDFEVAVPA